MQHLLLLAALGSRLGVEEIDLVGDDLGGVLLVAIAIGVLAVVDATLFRDFRALPAAV